MSSTVKIGDRFRRPSKFHDIYRVVALRAVDRHLVLADLVSEAQSSETMTLPVTMLLNTGQWRPVTGA